MAEKPSLSKNQRVILEDSYKKRTLEEEKEGEELLRERERERLGV